MKLSPHGVTDDSLGFIRGANCTLAKFASYYALAKESKEAGAITIGRWVGEGWPGEGVYAYDPSDYAALYLNSIKQHIELNPDIGYWEGLNEPPIGLIGQMQWYSAFEAERTRLLMLGWGKGSVVGNFSVGTPDISLIPSFKEAIDTIRVYGGMLGLHEYGNWRNLGYGLDKNLSGVNSDTWLLLRFVRWINQYGNDFKIAITECGTDRLEVNLGDGAGDLPKRMFLGSNGQFDVDAYAEYLMRYERELQKYSQVVGATIFGWNLGSEFSDFEMDRTGLSDRLIAYANLPEPEPIPEPPVPPTPSPNLNLLENGDFENGIFDTADGWLPWWAEIQRQSEDDKNYAYKPQWNLERLASGAAPDAIYSGGVSQRIVLNWNPWWAGIKRNVHVGKGATIHFSAMARLFRANDFWPAPSDTTQPGQVRVGIEPHGSGDQFSDSVIWSDPIAPFDMWQGAWVNATAQADEITVIIEADYRGSIALFQTAFFDSAYLAITEDAPPPPPPPAYDRWVGRRARVSGSTALRASPSLFGTILTFLTEGTVMPVAEETEAWIRVTSDGWCIKSACQKLSADMYAKAKKSLHGG